LGVTEERLLGGLDLDATLATGRLVAKPGILSEADGGLVYLDEANLLDPQLAHLLLDAASSGTVLLERDGLSLALPARVALLGSMNPEEGPLGPQLEDRFALRVALIGEADPMKRAEIVRRALAFERDPVAFRESFREKSEGMSHAIRIARAMLPRLKVGDAARARAAYVASKSRAAGHRADIALCLAARAGLALGGPWQGAARDPECSGPFPEESLIVTPDHVDRVEALVMASRARPEGRGRARPAPAILESAKDGNARAAKDQPTYVLNSDEIPPGWDPTGPAPDGAAPVRVFEAASEYQVITPKLPKEMGPKGQRGRRSQRETPKAQGRAYRTTARRLGRPISISATLRAAAPRQRDRAKRLGPGENAGRIILSPSDFREKVYRHKTGRLVLFVVDSSGSIGTLYRMEEAKAAAMSLLKDAYRMRDRVAIIAFYGVTAELLLPPTNSPDLAGRLLSALPSGGKTPLSAALALTHKLLTTERAKDPLVSPFVVLMTDGRPNIPLDPASQPWHEALRFASRLADDPSLNFLVVDTDRGAYNEFKLTKELAARLRAPKISLEDLREGRLGSWLDGERGPIDPWGPKLEPY
jgi:magnesium chelatase subunit D